MALNRLMILESAQKMKALFLDTVFPIECLRCGREGEWLCRDCFRKIKFKSSQYCLHCKKENRFGQFCLSCRGFYYLDGVWIAGDYENEIIAKLVKNLKYRFAKDISKVLGRFIALFLCDLINKNRLAGIDLQNREVWRKFVKIKEFPQIFLQLKDSLIMPVPLSKRRERWRGFNQAEAISRETAHCFDLEVSVNELIRFRHTKAQAKLGEEERKHNVKSCFAWKSENLSGRNIILVDDVVTTGSTLNECARILKENGAVEVWGLVAAKG